MKGEGRSRPKSESIHQHPAQLRQHHHPLVRPRSHCVACDDFSPALPEIQARDPNLAQKVYLLEDCTSAVVVPDVVDFTDQANETFQGFADAGMHLVQSTQPVEEWPGGGGGGMGDEWMVSHPILLWP